MKVINLFSGPGTGKTTTAARLFAELKMQSKRCEYVPEFAKGLVYNESYRELEHQEWVFANQHHWMYRLRNKVDMIITDAPLFNSIVYSGKGEEHKDFHNYVYSVFSRYDNLNIYLERETVYQQDGRYQDEKGAKMVDEEVLKLFRYFNVKYVKVGLHNVIPTIISLL
jgi:nicotinamide riboside kinase